LQRTPQPVLLVKGHRGIQERKPVNLENILYDCRSMLFASIDKKDIQLTKYKARNLHDKRRPYQIDAGNLKAFQ